ncbi:MAG TPA: alkanesulfonate monooxygenase [Acetobacteraceae bacterium]|jgi:alkanesulfonate monooxygenase|nr:alkanesulfonate monooxygenase [Acetobacteraceae bacterium]
MQGQLEFGWFLPTAGDTTCYGDRSKWIVPSAEMFDRVVLAAEAAGFEYFLVPVAATCWEAWISSAMAVAKTKRIKALVAARPGYVSPVQLAKMGATFDQLSGGRLAINLIAGQSEIETEAEGIKLPKEDRYALMDEDVTIMKALWCAPGSVTFDGRFHTLKGARISPQPLQRPYPRFYLGGGSMEAWALSAKHADVHLFWGDTPDRIEANMTVIRGMAARHGRTDLAFGMRLQICCRETEAEAWDAARELVRGVTDAHTNYIRTHYAGSAANQRVQQLAMEHGDLIGPHLWTGVTRVRPGAGIVVVGNPRQCADTLQQFIDLGCSSFCLSGYLHDEEAERFARLVRPLLAERNAGRMLAA